jgi:hypothetical protein
MNIYLTFLLVCGNIILFPYLTFSSELDWSSSDSKKSPDPLTLTSKRAQMASSIIAIQEEIKKRNDKLTYFAQSIHDQCYMGQNSWKVKEGYSNRCSYRVTYFYGFDGDFKEVMTKFDDDLLKSGWKAASPIFSLKYIFQNYYDSFYGADKPKPGNFPDQYLVSDMPKTGYKKDSLVLSVVYAEKRTKDLFEIDSAQSILRGGLLEFYEHKEFQDVKKLFNEITLKNEYVVTLSIQDDYFEN